MKAGSMMISYQPLGDLPNFFRSIISNQAQTGQVMQWSAFISLQWKQHIIINCLSMLLHVNKEKLLIDNFSLFTCLYMSLLFESLVEIKIKSRLHCIDIYTTILDNFRGFCLGLDLRVDLINSLILFVALNMNILELDSTIFASEHC